MTTPHKRGRSSNRPKIVVWLLATIAIILPTVLNILFSASTLAGYRSISLTEPVSLSSEAVVLYQGEPTGATAVLATLASWSGATSSPERESIVALLDQSDEDVGERERLRSAFASLGFEGTWLQAEPGALYRLKTPYVAVLETGQPRLVLVRSARQGFLYIFDPREGNVLMEHDEFMARWEGLLFAFPDPPQPPGGG